MKRALYTLFTAYGRIVDIVHQRSDHMRCVAFVIFRDIQSATTALRGLNGFIFYDRPLVSYILIDTILLHTYTHIYILETKIC
jgi:RNA recognition motif-containing protein